MVIRIFSCIFSLLISPDLYGKAKIKAASPLLVLDAKNTFTAPKRLRILIKRSASGQFSMEQFRYLRQKIPASPLVVIDLREEPHGFINGIAVGWKDAKNRINKGFSVEAVEEDENKRLRHLKGPLIYYEVKKNPEATEFWPFVVENPIVLDEEHYLKSLDVTYVRIPITDDSVPEDRDMDLFFAVLQQYQGKAHFHFHCRSGMGRTTLMLVLMDIIESQGNTPLEDILSNYKDTLPEKPHKVWKKKFYKKRNHFLRTFHEWVKSGAYQRREKWIFTD